VTAAISLGLGCWSGFRIWRTRMSSRALSLATVMFLIGCLAAIRAQAQNLDAGKSPSQIFAGTCSECHKSSRGLLRKIPAASLPGFLRQHYTTGGEMASVLSAYLLSNGAADRRLSGGQPKPGTDARPDETRPDQADRRGRRLRPAESPQEEAARPAAEPRQAARPDANGVSPQVERRGRRRLARPGEAPDGAKPSDGQTPSQSAGEPSEDSRGSAARLKRGRPGNEEPPKSDAAKMTAGRTDDAKTDAAKTDTSKVDAGKVESSKSESSSRESAKDGRPSTETATGEDIKSEAAKPSGEAGSDASKIDAPKATGSGESPALRADPVPSVTPAPAATPAPPTAVSSTPPEHASVPPATAATPPAPPAAPSSVTASAPPPPAGPPAPPISQ
jgi:hypothetical protein